MLLQEEREHKLTYSQIPLDLEAFEMKQKVMKMPEEFSKWIEDIQKSYLEAYHFKPTVIDLLKEMTRRGRNCTLFNLSIPDDTL